MIENRKIASLTPIFDFPIYMMRTAALRMTVLVSTHSTRQEVRLTTPKITSIDHLMAMETF